MKFNWTNYLFFILLILELKLLICLTIKKNNSTTHSTLIPIETFNENLKSEDKYMHRKQDESQIKSVNSSIGKNINFTNKFNQTKYIIQINYINTYNNTIDLDPKRRNDSFIYDPPIPDPNPIPIPYPIIDPNPIPIPPPYVDFVISGERNCPEKIDLRLEKEFNEEIPNEDYIPTGPPKMKPNIYKIMSYPETRHINYFFDYFDEFFIKKKEKTFLQLIAEEFKKEYEAAISIGKNYVNKLDPYTPIKLLFFYSNGIQGENPFPKHKWNSSDKQQRIEYNENWIFDNIKKYNKNFKPEIYKLGISPSVVLQLLYKWKCKFNKDIMYAKMLVDTYDLDGDGALNLSEFILFTIKFTMKRKSECSDFCFKDIIENILEPLFLYFDCNKDGLIKSESMWKSLKYLVRKDQEKYDIYQCQLKYVYNKDVHTKALNDFILKNGNKKIGILNKMEFTQGILMGYWERQVAENQIFTDSTLANKDTRWSENGETDLQCQIIKKYESQTIPKFQINEFVDEDYRRIRR